MKCLVVKPSAASYYDGRVSLYSLGNLKMWILVAQYQLFIYYHIVMLKIKSY